MGGYRTDGAGSMELRKKGVLRFLRDAPGPVPGKDSMRRFQLLIAFLCLLVLAVPVSADSAVNTTMTPGVTAGTPNGTETAATTAPEGAGGSVYFDTDPAGATIWVNDENLGTSPFTYYFDTPGTLNVTARKKGYTDSAGTVTVSPGKRVVFFTQLTQIIVNALAETTSSETSTTVTTPGRSNIVIPTPWPTSTPAPLDPSVACAAIALGAGFLAIRRR